jgi:hypothetical protein
LRGTHLGNPFSSVGVTLFWGITFEVGMLGTVLGVLTWVLGLSLQWSDVAVIAMYALVVVGIEWWALGGTFVLHSWGSCA